MTDEPGTGAYIAQAWKPVDPIPHYYCGVEYRFIRGYSLHIEEPVGIRKDHVYPAEGQRSSSTTDVYTGPASFDQASGLFNTNQAFCPKPSWPQHNLHLILLLITSELSVRQPLGTRFIVLYEALMYSLLQPHLYSTRGSR